MAKIRLQTRYTLLCYIIQFTAGGGEGDICEENGLRRVGQRVKEALAGEVLRVGCVRLAEAEETAVCVCAAVGVDLLRLPEGGPGVRPAGVEGGVG